jgi:hypothetical protein
MNDLVRALKRELSQLEAALRHNPTFVKIERIKATLEAYENDSPAASAAIVPNERVTAPVVPAETRGRATNPSKRSRVYDTVEELIRSRGPTHRKELLAEVSARGLMGSEKNPMQSLAIYLSDAKGRFKSVGDGMWDLRDDLEQGRGGPENEGRPEQKVPGSELAIAPR